MSLNFKKINIEKCEKFPKDKVNIPSLIEDLEFIKVKRPFLYEELLNLKDENNKPYDLNDNSKENVANIQKRYFVVKAYEYLEKRFVENNISDEAKPYYLDRFEFELKTINSMKFDGYTLLVNDFLSTLNVKLGGLIGPGRGCLTKEALVYTYNNEILDFKQINEISIGDKVITHNNLIKEVKNTFVYDIEENLLEIETFHADKINPIILTKDHKIYCGNNVWKQAKEITTKDYLYLPIPKYKVNKINSWNMEDYSQYTKNKNYKIENDYLIYSYSQNILNEFSIKDLSKKLNVARSTINKFVKYLNKENTNITQKTIIKISNLILTKFKTLEDWLSYINNLNLKKIKKELNNSFLFRKFLGRWIGDGSIRKNLNREEVNVVFHKNDDIGINETLNFIQENNYKYKISYVKSICSITILDAYLHSFFKNIFSEYNFTSNSKYFPYFIFNLPKNEIKDIIDGYIAADGHIDKYTNRIRCSSVSKKLSFQLRKLLLQIGIPSTIKTYKRKESDHHIKLNKNNKEHLIEFPSIKTVHNVPNINKNIYEVENDYIKLRVRKINELNKVKTKVYDFTVEDDHSYTTTNYIVHNSAAGSLVSWAYGITNVDPMLHYKNTSSHLLFERYLNPERISLPDIDMDMNGLINKNDLILKLENESDLDETIKTFLDIIKEKYPNEDFLEGKGLIEDYQISLYGNDKVAKIVTRDTYQAKSSIAAVCRYLGNDFANEAGFKYKGTPYIELANKISGTAFTKPGIKFNDIFDVNSKFYNQYFINMYDSNYHVRTIVDLAKKLEGTIANYGVHAAGVLILDPKNNYTNDGYMVIGGTNVSVFDGKYVEDYINIKFDFLGLASLEEIDKTLKFIEKRHGKEKRDEVFKIINNENLLYNDKDIFRKVFDIQNTKKIFQFSSDGMQDLVKRIEPDNFDELVAITALYRPGPMESGMVDMYIKNKFNKENVYVEFEELREILEPTHQTITYQEQIMKIVQVLGGFSLGGADLVRRAMGKKIKEELDNLKGQFIEGALKKYEGRHLTLNNLEQFAISQELILYYNGQDIEFKTVKEMNDLNLGEQFSEKEFGRLIIKKGEKLNIPEDYITRLLANNLFENIIKFAGYGFNKSHAYAYTNVSMQMAYLKAHYPLEFFASIFVNNSDDIEKLTEYIVDGKKNGIIIYGVDINKSNLEFDTIDNKAIIYGLSNIKGISNKDIKTILKDREENGLYKSFSDFLLRFIKNHCSFKTLENLINVGAFDSLEFTQGVDLGKLVFDNALNKISITEDDEIYNLRLLNKSNYLKGLIDGKFDIFDNVEDTLQAKYIKFFELEEKTHLLPFIITKTLKTKESTIKKIFNGKTDNAKIKFVSDIEESYIAMEELKGLIVVPKDLDKEENKRAFFTKVGKLFEINKFTEKQIEDIEEIYQNKKSLIKTSNIEFEATGSLSNIGSILVKDYVFKDDFIVPKLNLLLNPFDIEGDFFYKVVAKDIIKGENDEGDLYLSLVVLDVNGMETRFYFNNDQISRFKNNIEEGDPLIIEVNVKEGKNTFYKKIVNIEVLKESDNWKKYDCFKPRPLNIKQLDQDKIRQDFAKVDFCDLEQLAIDWRNSLNGWKGLSPDANRTLCFILSNYRVGVSSKTGNPYQIVSISDGLDNKSIDLFYFDVAESDLKNNLNKPILVELAKRNEKYGLGAGYKTKIEFLGDGYLKEEKSTKKVEEETFLEILDGREHINVYSKGRTLLGRKLSNFADIPTMVEIDGETIKFKNVESLWFYLKIYLTFGEKDTNLLDMEGYEAKEYGSKRLKLSRPLTTEEREYFIDIMKKGIEWKIRNNEALREEFKANYKKIPYAHYYNYSGNIITLPEHQWLVDFLNELEV